MSREEGKLIVRLYADNILIKETDDEKIWCAVMNKILENQEQLSRIGSGGQGEV